MKIALLGYGKMGKAIEKIALQRGHTIILKLDKNATNFAINIADIAIDFSTPSAAYKNISTCINNNIPIVSGTTGWLTKFNDIKKLCKQKNGAFIYASNFSVGATVFFELNEYLAKMMCNLNQYNISIKEIHHTKKLDAPSGTAITLAEGIIKNTSKKNWELNATNNKDTIPIVAKRIADVTGTHSIKYKSIIDSIAIKHTANNRDGFAIGAIIAAEWLLHKKGIFTMKDVLDL